MHNTIPPTFGAATFECPFCGASTQQQWTNLLSDVNVIGDDHPQKSKHKLNVSRCIICGEHSIWLDKKMVWPRATGRKPIPQEVPIADKSLSEDYLEACLVLGDSPKASAALSRRCLQHILVNHMGAQGRDLSKQIDWVMSNSGLPSHVSSDLDAVRVIGNFAAHPMKNTNTGEITEVEDHEAGWNLDVIESLFDFVFVQPAIAKLKRAALNQKLIDAGKQPLP